ncbi:MAG: cell wall metabolism sensor histidine kinase WalK [Coriobacteriia bacterium]|nr:cell wall metabolism sensor histidine kinase WalK [Coriobacteriia bacterium]
MTSWPQQVRLGLIRLAARKLLLSAEELSDAAAKMADGDLLASIPSADAALVGLHDSLVSLRNQTRTRVAELEIERAGLRAALSELTDAVILAENGAVVFANPSAIALFGAEVSRPGTPLEKTLPASVAQAIETKLANHDTLVEKLSADPTGRSLSLRVSPLKMDPSGSLGSLSSYPLDPSPARVIIAITDITTATHLDTVRREFVANASHELKTPVTSIKLLADSANTAASDGDSTLALSFASQISQETDRLQRLVTDLLDLSRLESTPTYQEVTDVRKAIDNAMVTHRNAAAHKDLKLSVDLGEVHGTDLFVLAHPTDLAIALDNLIDNAIAYTNAGSVTVSATATNDTVLISVSDTGCGIAPEYLPRIFERFFRVDQARSRQMGGTGLGLALVRNSIERNKGSVSVKSEPGVGSDFVVSLPRAC